MGQVFRDCNVWTFEQLIEILFVVSGSFVSGGRELKAPGANQLRAETRGFNLRNHENDTNAHFGSTYSS